MNLKTTGVNLKCGESYTDLVTDSTVTGCQLGLLLQCSFRGGTSHRNKCLCVNRRHIGARAAVWRLSSQLRHVHRAQHAAVVMEPRGCVVPHLRAHTQQQPRHQNLRQPFLATHGNPTKNTCRSEGATNSPAPSLNFTGSMIVRIPAGVRFSLSISSDEKSVTARSQQNAKKLTWPEDT